MVVWDVLLSGEMQSFIEHVLSSPIFLPKQLRHIYYRIGFGLVLLELVHGAGALGVVNEGWEKYWMRLWHLNVAINKLIRLHMVYACGVVIGLDLVESA